MTKKIGNFFHNVVNLKDIRGCVVSPNILKEEANFLFKYLVKQSGQKKVSVAFVDIKLTSEIIRLILRLQAKGIDVHIFDHHWDSLVQSRIDSFPRVKHLPKIRSRVMDGSQYKSCASLIRPGEFVRKGINIVCYDGDGDGILSLLQGCGCGYPELVLDSQIMDRGSKKGQKLSLTGRLILDSLCNSDINRHILPDEYQEYVENEAPKIIESIIFPDKISSKLYKEKNWEKSQRRKNNFMAIVREEVTLVKGNIAFLDIRERIKGGMGVSIGPLIKAVNGIFPKTSLYAYTDILRFRGAIRNVVTVRLPPRCTDTDLRDFLDKRAYQAQVSYNRLRLLEEDEWSSFLNNWQQAH